MLMDAPFLDLDRDDDDDGCFLAPSLVLGGLHLFLGAALLPLVAALDVFLFLFCLALVPRLVVALRFIGSIADSKSKQTLDADADGDLVVSMTICYIHGINICC